jgi:hypothetical protein
MHLGLLTGLLVLGDPQAIDFAREARPYACVQLIGLLQVVCFLRLQQNQGPIFVGWVGLTWVMFYCHYTSALLLLGELAYVILVWLGRPTRQWRDLAVWLLGFALCFLGILAAWQPLAAIAARRQNWARFVPQASWTEILQLFGGGLYVIVPALCACALVAWAHRWPVRWTLPRFLLSRLLFCSCWYLVPVLTAWFFTQQDWARLFFRRYLIVVGLVPMIAAGSLGGLLPRGRWQSAFAVSVLFVTLVGWGAQRPWSSDSIWRRHRSEDWRGAVQWINSDPQSPRWPVYLRPGLIEDDAIRNAPNPALQSYCLFPLRALYKLRSEPPAWVVIPSSHSWDWSAEERQHLQRWGGAWLILRQSPRAAGETVRRLVTSLERAGVSVSVRQRRQFGLVTVVLLQANTDPPSVRMQRTIPYPRRGANGDKSIGGLLPRINSVKHWAVAGAR